MTPPEITFVRLPDVAPDALIELMNDPIVRRHLPLARGRFDAAACARFVAAKEALWAAHGYGPYGFMSGGQLIGWGGLQPEAGDVDLGIVLHPRFWGLGRGLYRRLLAEAVERLRVASVIVLLPPSRVRTSGLRRLGFVPDGEIQVGGTQFLRFRRWVAGYAAPPPDPQVRPTGRSQPALGAGAPLPEPEHRKR
jgi:[ribosomal protein S5]-alanine N-acetyltransferase